MKYACLVEGCDQLFGQWGEVRRHMKKCGYDGGKPKLQDSAAKANAVIADDPELSAVAAAESVLPKPWENVSEEELAEVIRSFYARTDVSAADKRKHVQHRAIVPKYGRFPFGNFGVGSLEDFLMAFI